MHPSVAGGVQTPDSCLLRGKRRTDYGTMVRKRKPTSHGGKKAASRFACNNDHNGTNCFGCYRRRRRCCLYCCYRCVEKYQLCDFSWKTSEKRCRLWGNKATWSHTHRPTCTSLSRENCASSSRGQIASSSREQNAK